MILNLDETMGAVAYNAYRMAPNNAPRKIDVVMDKIKAYLMKNYEQPFESDKTFWCKEFEQNDVSVFMHDMLFSIPEFSEWNLSQIEFEKGISVDDDSRGKFAFTSMYDVRDNDYWKNDFIDLDAFLQNVCMTISKTKG